MEYNPWPVSIRGRTSGGFLTCTCPYRVNLFAFWQTCPTARCLTLVAAWREFPPSANFLYPPREAVGIFVLVAGEQEGGAAD